MMMSKGKLFRLLKSARALALHENRGVISQLRFSHGTGTGTGTANNVQRTALYDFHVKHGGKVVNFGGYALPVQYADLSITASHLHTRQNSSIFDVSHMLQTLVHGKDAIDCIESVCTANLKGIPDGSGTLTVFTNNNGGILDDLIIMKVNENFLYIVSNAAMKKTDMALMSAVEAKFKSNGKDVRFEFMSPSDRSMIAVQGPKSVSVLSKLLPSDVHLDKLYFMNTILSEVAGIPNCRITRCGYTGEDGVEISVDSQHIQHITEALLAADPESMKMAGLGARDSLRLEAGLCLYGSDIDATTTPVEAGLSWLIAKRRQSELNFPGAQRICDQLKTGATRRRVGLQMVGDHVPPARAHVNIYGNTTTADTSSAKEIGSVTSGGPSPSLNKNIAMGYIHDDYKKQGTIVKLKIREKYYDAVVTKMPFVKSNYYIKPKV